MMHGHNHKFYRSGIDHYDLNELNSRRGKKTLPIILQIIL
jgi:hypothetical protein